MKDGAAKYDVYPGEIVTLTVVVEDVTIELEVMVEDIRGRKVDLVVSGVASSSRRVPLSFS